MNQYFVLLGWLGCRLGEHILGHYGAAKKCWLLRCWLQDFSLECNFCSGLWFFLSLRDAFEYDIYPEFQLDFRDKNLELNQYSVGQIVFEIWPGNTKCDVREIWRSGALRQGGDMWGKIWKFHLLGLPDHFPGESQGTDDNWNIQFNNYLSILMCKELLRWISNTSKKTCGSDCDGWMSHHSGFLHHNF